MAGVSKTPSRWLFSEGSASCGGRPLNRSEDLSNHRGPDGRFGVQKSMVINIWFDFENLQHYLVGIPHPGGFVDFEGQTSRGAGKYGSIHFRGLCVDQISLDEVTV